MNKLVCLVVCALVACELVHGGQAPAGGQGFNLNIVPAAATVCAQGCPFVCQLMRSFCPPIPGFLPACDLMKTQCDAACTQTCACVTQCGPNCDAFEANCANLGIPVIPGVFCPVVGGVCDIGCVVSCPQTTLANIIQGVFSQVTATVQQFIMSLMGGPVPQARVAPVKGN